MPVFPSLTLRVLSATVPSALTLVLVSSPSSPQSCFSALDLRSTASLDSAPDLLTRFLISLPPASASVRIPYYKKFHDIQRLSSQAFDTGEICKVGRDAFSVCHELVYGGRQTLNLLGRSPAWHRLCHKSMLKWQSKSQCL